MVEHAWKYTPEVWHGTWVLKSFFSGFWGNFNFSFGKFPFFFWRECFWIHLFGSQSLDFSSLRWLVSDILTKECEHPRCHLEGYVHLNQNEAHHYHPTQLLALHQAPRTTESWVGKVLGWIFGTCFWLVLLMVGRNPQLHQLMVKIPLFTFFKIYLNWCRISESSTVFPVYTRGYDFLLHSIEGFNSTRKIDNSCQVPNGFCFPRESMGMRACQPGLFLQWFFMAESCTGWGWQFHWWSVWYACVLRDELHLLSLLIKLSWSWFKYQRSEGPTKPTSPGNDCWCTNPGPLLERGFPVFNLDICDFLHDGRSCATVRFFCAQNSLQMVKVVAEITPSGYVWSRDPTNDLLLFGGSLFFL